MRFATVALAVVALVALTGCGVTTPATQRREAIEQQKRTNDLLERIANERRDCQHP